MTYTVTNIAKLYLAQTQRNACSFKGEYKYSANFFIDLLMQLLIFVKKDSFFPKISNKL